MEIFRDEFSKCGSVYKNEWECEFSNCGSVPKNKWECGSVSFQISGSVSKNEWECGSVSLKMSGSVVSRVMKNSGKVLFWVGVSDSGKFR